MKERRGGGKEREAPTHLVKNSKLTHAARVTKKYQADAVKGRSRFRNRASR